MKALIRKSAFTLCLLFAAGLAQAETGIVTVQVQVAPGKNWTNYPTRTLATLPADGNQPDGFGLGSIWRTA